MLKSLLQEMSNKFWSLSHLVEGEIETSLFPLPWGTASYKAATSLSQEILSFKAMRPSIFYALRMDVELLLSGLTLQSPNKPW